MISERQINHRFYVLGVLAAAVIPRQPSDHGAGASWIGGRLSRNFRILLLVIVTVNFCRLLLSDDTPRDKESGYHQLGSDLLGVVEVTGLTFLAFLTPYVLETGLAQFMNIIPGRNLKIPLILSALLSFFGVVLSRMVHPNFWALKKLANAVSGPPVIRALRSYNRFTTSETHGRGFVIGQSVAVIEYWHLVIQLSCAAAYAMNRHLDRTEEETILDRMMEAARSISFVADWTRILVHAMFLNMLDEMYHTSNFSDSTNTKNDNTANDNTAVRELVPLRRE